MNKVMIYLIATIFLINFVNASDISLTEFYSAGCISCAEVENSGIIELIQTQYDVNVTKLDAKENYDLFQYYVQALNTEEIVPMVILQQDGKFAVLQGDNEIVENLEEYIINPDAYITQNLSNDYKEYNIGIIAVVIAGIIDSINPCAFGVLIFLMIALLNLGSRKRALRAGLLYSFVVFLVYLSVGLGLFHTLQQLSNVRNIIYIVVGILICILSLIEFRDYWAATKGKGAVLKISDKIKPFIEKEAKNGTILAIMILGVVVALFELPCTGVIYLGIISLLTNGNASAYLYLLLYNIIFVLPLVILTFLVYYGISPKKLEKWNSDEKAWMRLAAAIVMLLISGYLLYVGLR